MRVSVVVKIVGVDDVHVADVGVVDVDVAPVVASAAIPRTEGLAPTEREPAYAAAKSKTESETAAKEANERGTIEGATIDRTQRP